jgi:hypothetical protein
MYFFIGLVVFGGAVALYLKYGKGYISGGPALPGSAGPKPSTGPKV